jgi:hypothetical protein
MRFRRPRFTIASLMALVVIASLVSMGIVNRIERNRLLAALQVALANYKNSKLARELAEITVREYIESIYKSDIQTLDHEIALAKSDLERTLGRSGTNEQANEQARVRLERAQQNKARLETVTKDNTVKDLEGEVARAAAAEQSAKATYDQLHANLAKSWW